jgi:glycosyltransferase involved in cell wall biosynthesis
MASVPLLVVVSSASAAPMGAQVYEEQIANRAAAALLAHGRTPRWEVRREIFRSLRSPLSGTRRLPMGWVSGAEGRSRALVGRVAYPRGALVHRMGLELPPGPTEVVTLHDVVAWRFVDESAPVRAAAAELRRAAAVICVSEFSASEASELLGIRNPVVVPNGVDARFLSAAPATPEERAVLGLVGPYVLHAGGAAARKNLDSLAQAWPIVHREHPDLTLALAGPPHPRRNALFAGMPGTRLLGRLPDPVVPGIVAAAAAVVVPSTYEGFGLPALEGMAARVPVVAARCAALPEVVGDGGVLVEPTPGAIAAGLLDVLAGGADVLAMVRRGRARAATFSWERSAAGHAAVWSSVAP